VIVWIAQLSIRGSRGPHEGLRVDESDWIRPDRGLNHSGGGALDDLKGDRTNQIELVSHQVFCGAQHVEVGESHLRKAVGVHPNAAGHFNQMQHMDLNDIEGRIVAQFVGKPRWWPERLGKKIDNRYSVLSEYGIGEP
jgi:hypothetical protein